MHYLPYALIAALTIYSLVDCSATSMSEIRNLPKWAWILLMILVAPLGAIAYLIAGRPRRGGAGRRPTRKIIPPDDDPDFLRRL